MHILPFRKELLCSHGSSDSTASRNAVQKRLRTGRMKQDGARFRACPWKQMWRQRRPRQAAPDARRWGGRARENRCGARGGHGKRRRMQEGEGVACDQCCSARWYGVAGDGQTATSTPSAARQRFVGIISYPPVGALSNSKSFLHGAMASLCVHADALLSRLSAYIRPAYQCMCTCCTTVWSWHLFLKQLHGRWVSLNILSCTSRNEHLPFKFQLRRVYTNYNYGAQFYVAGVHARKRSMLCLMARSY
jgi:hypothetical protein